MIFFWKATVGDLKIISTNIFIYLIEIIRLYYFNK